MLSRHLFESWGFASKLDRHHLCSNNIYGIGADIKQTSKYKNKINVLEMINMMKKTKQDGVVESA